MAHAKVSKEEVLSLIHISTAWSARVIVEYDSTLANALETSLQRTKQVQTQALLTWLPHPGTVLYICLLYTSRCV